MKTFELAHSSDGKWRLGNYLLGVGTLLEIRIDGRWLEGRIEAWQQTCCWISRIDSVAVILRSGQLARLPFKGV